MDIAPTAVDGAWVVSPKVHGDDRGAFLEWFRADLLAAATGRDFAVRQANHSISRRGALRGIHFADVPPGQAKLVYCPRGAVLDVIVDLRVGSPTYAAQVTVQLDAVDRRAVFLAEGLGHAFLALEDDSSVTYLVSSTYDPAVEHAVHPGELDIWDRADPARVSAKDLAAPTLAQAEAQGLLPSYDVCRRWYADHG